MTQKSELPSFFVGMGVGYRGDSVSPVGAAGVWQLMPGTTDSYGLLVTAEQDERFDVEKSTDVAARVLRDLRRSKQTVADKILFTCDGC